MSSPVTAGVMLPDHAEHSAPSESPAAPPAEPSEREILDRYLGRATPGGMSRRTDLLRRALRGETRRRATRFWVALGGLGLVILAATGYATVQRNRVARAGAAAAQLFYAAKALELEVSRLVLSAEERQAYRTRQADLEHRYRDYLEELGIYGDGTPPRTRAIYEVVHRFGETEVGVPKRFLRDVERRIASWKGTGRLDSSVARARVAAYGPKASAILLENDLAPDFFYLAFQESEFKVNAVGPRTRFGIAKGMWQLIPGTAREYGLHTGPLVSVPRPDPLDERHDFEKSTQAAARYLRDIYTTDAQASGLLVIAAYNWGQTRMLRLIRSLPPSPNQRNYWTLLARHREEIPRETYDYVINVVAAAAVCLDPSLFGFRFPPLLPPVDALAAPGQPAAGP
jgi:hypothetical protein